MDSILKIEKSRSTAIRSVRDRLLKESEIREAVEAAAGARFKDAVMVCLMGSGTLGISTDEDEADQKISVRLSRGFHEKVVRRLEEIQT